MEEPAGSACWGVPWDTLLPGEHMCQPERRPLKACLEVILSTRLRLTAPEWYEKERNKE